MQRYCSDALTAWAAAVLQSAGVPAADAQITARVLVRSDMRGYSTHGLARLASYLDRLNTGAFNARPRIEFDRRGSAWRVDADGALGQVAAQRIIDEAVAALRQQPLLWVSVRHVSHLGALGVVALPAAEAGFICFMGQRTPPLLGLPGFTRPAIGHNPFAFAAPAGARPPLVFDVACSVAARGHILLAAREGRPIPPEWALDPSGRATTDASAAASGSLQPVGGYKGMGLAMMIECLAAALGADANFEADTAMVLPAGGAVPRESAFFLLLDPGALGDADAFAGYMKHWMKHYADSSKPGGRLPGERAHADEVQARRDGVEYPSAVDGELRQLAETTRIPLPAPA